MFVLLLPASAIAQSSGGSFSITHSSTDPSSPALNGGAFSLHATVGQPNTTPVSAGAFELTGGFNAVKGSDVIFANGFES
jgi:hypothetical protein